MAMPAGAVGGNDRTVKVFETYKNAWSLLWEKFGVLLGMMLLFILAAGVSGVAGTIWGAGAGSQGDAGLSALGTYYGLSWLYGVLVTGPLSYGVYYGYLRTARGEDAQLGDAFEGFRKYGNAVGAGVLVSVLTVVGFLLLIIPGIIAMVRLFFVPFLVTDESMGAIDAIRESWDRTRGHGWRIFGLLLLAIPIGMVGALLLLIGLIPAFMWIYLAAACFFRDVTGSPGETQEGNGPAPGAGTPVSEPAVGARVEA